MVLLQQNEVLDDLDDSDSCKFGQLVNESNIGDYVDWGNKLMNALHINIRSVYKTLII